MKKRTFIFLIFMLFPVFLYSEKKDLSEYSKDNLISFTNSLVKRGDWFRAYSEINRLEYYYGKSFVNSELFISQDYVLFNSRKFKYHFDTRLLDDERFRISSSIFAFDSGKTEYLLNNKIDLDSKYLDLSYYVKKRKMINSLNTGRFSDASALIKHNENISKYSYLLDYSKKQRDLMKNPTASMLYGIIPGMGYVYAGNRNTGITAFVVVAINILKQTTKLSV